MDYPFPTTPTILALPCLHGIHKMDVAEVEMMFDDPDHILGHISDWRALGERELVAWWTSGRGPVNMPAKVDPHVTVEVRSVSRVWLVLPRLAHLSWKVRGQIFVPDHLSPESLLLLRADTVFSWQKGDAPGGQGLGLHYPHFIEVVDDCPCCGTPADMNLARVYRHEEVEKVTRTLLDSLGMPDIAYIELKTLGAVFLCGRCCDNKLKTWDEIVSVLIPVHLHTVTNSYYRSNTIVKRVATQRHECPSSISSTRLRL
jgi:hypothetical protein